MSFSGTTFNGTAGTGRWLLKDTTVAKLMQFGGYPSDSISQSDTCSRCVQAMSTKGGGIVVLPVGDLYWTTVVDLASYVTIQGQGITTTKILLDGTVNTAFRSTGTKYEWRLRDLRISTASGVTDAGLGLYITSGHAVNIEVENVMFRESGGGVEVDSLLTHAKFSECDFQYHTAPSFYLDSGAVVNNLLFEHSRFEETYDSAFKVNTTVTEHNARFRDCVIEGCRGVYAADCGSNPFLYVFDGCHFEKNGNAGGTADSADILTRGGSGAITIQSCNFSTPSTNAVTHWNIRDTTSGPNLAFMISGNHVASRDAANPGNSANYGGFVRVVRNPRVTLIANRYKRADYDYIPLTTSLHQAVNDHNLGKMASQRPAIVKTLETADATPAAIYFYDFMGVEGTHVAVLVSADLACVSDDGSVKASYKRNILLYTDAGGTSASSIGSLGDSEQESDAGLNASWSVSTTSQGTATLTVTGLAATNLRWVAKIETLTVTN